jgi:hypothetical protein
MTCRRGGANHVTAISVRPGPQGVGALLLSLKDFVGRIDHVEKRS